MRHQNPIIDISRSRWRATGSTIVLAILILMYLIIFAIYAQIPTTTDFLKFYSSARFLLGGQSVYTPVTLDTISNVLNINPDLLITTIHPNLNPPFQTFLISPLGLLSYSIAFWTWSLISLTLGLFSVYLIYDAYRYEFRNSHVFELSIIFLLFFPTILTYTSGQISILLLFLVTIAWTSARSGKDRLAGIALGIALSLKIFSGLFIPVFIVQRRWKLLKWYLGTFFLVNFLAVFAVGLDDHFQYLRAISSITWYSASWNASFMGLFTRIFGGSESIPLINSPTIGSILTLVASTLAVLLLLWFAKLGDNNNKYYFDLVFSLTIVSMLLLSPLGWVYYFVVLIIPLIVAWHAAKQQGDILLKGLLIVAWILCTIPHGLIEGGELRPIDMFTWAGFPFYGLLLFMIILMILLRNSRNQSSKALTDGKG